MSENSPVQTLTLAPQTYPLSLEPAILHALPFGVLVCDVAAPNMPITYVNQAAEHLTGYNRTELIGQNARILQGPETDARTVASIRAAIRDQSEGTWVILNYRKDGTKYWNDLTLRAVRGPDGGVTHYLGMQVDCTKRVEAEKRLERNRRHLETVSELQNQFIATDDPVPVLERMLQGALAITDSQMGFIGEVFCDEAGQYLKTIPITDISWDEETKHLYEQNAPSGFIFRKFDNLFGAVVLTGAAVIANDPAHDPRRGGLPPGHPKIHSFLGIPFFAGSELIGMVGLANREGGYGQEQPDDLQPLVAAASTMITAIRLNRQQEQSAVNLEQSENRYRTFIDNAADAIFLIRPDGSIADVNRQACASLGYDREELVGKAIYDIDPILNRDNDARYQEQIKLGQVIQHESRHRRKDGSDFPVEIRTCPQLVDGETYALALARDITQHKRSEEVLRENVALLNLTNRMTKVGGWVSDLRTGELRWTQETYRIHELPMDAGIPVEQVFEFYHPDERGEIKELLENAIATGAGFDQKFRFVTAKGKPRKVRVICRPEIENGLTVCLYGTLQDITEHEASVDALRQSREELLTAQRVAQLGIWEWDFVNDFVHFSEQVYEMLGLQPGSFVPTLENALALAPDFEREALRSRIEATLRVNAPFSFDSTYTRPDGKQLWLYVEAFLRHDAEGKPASILGIAQDITARKLAEADAAFSHLVLQKAGDSIMVCEAAPIDEPGPRIVYVNEAFETTLGYSRQESLGRSPRFLQGPRTDREALRKIRTALELHQPVRVELQNYRKDGSPIWVELDIKPVALNGQGISHFVALQRDISARVQLEKQLRDFQKLCVTGPVVFARWSIEAPYPFLWVTDNIRKFGFDPEILINQRIAFLDVMHPDDRQRIHQEIVAAHASDARPLCYTTTYRIVCPDGTIRWIFDFTNVALNDDEKPLHAEGYLIDITEQKEAEIYHAKIEERLRANQRLESLGVLAGGLAHDFNNILTTILGYASFVQAEMKASEAARTYLSEIEKSKRQASELCHQLLAYAGKGKFMVGPMNIVQVVKDSVELLRLSVSKKANLLLHLDPLDKGVSGDANQLRQVVMNLLMNASDALEDKVGSIVVTIGSRQVSPADLDTFLFGDKLSAGEYIFLTVADTGCGMDSATRARMFDPFFTTKPQGRGLGMASTQGIVKSHGGALRVDSTPGQGTSIEILLPLCALPQPVDASPQVKRQSFTGLALVADDEDRVRALTALMLRSLGFEVIEARDGQEAIELTRAHVHDLCLLLLDLTMPRLHGSEAYPLIRAITPRLPILLVSGYSALEFNLPIEDTHVAFVQKPFKKTDLIAVINKISTPHA